MPTDGTFRHHTHDGRDLGHVSKIGAFAEHTVVSADSLVKIDPHLPAGARLPCWPARSRPATGRRHIGPRSAAATPWWSSARAASAPRPSRAHASTAPPASSPSTPSNSSASRPSTFGATHAVASVEAAIAGARSHRRRDGRRVVVAPSTVGERRRGRRSPSPARAATCVLTGSGARRRHRRSRCSELHADEQEPVRHRVRSCNPNATSRAGRLYESGLLHLDEMVTRRYRLDEINDAYADLLNGRIDPRGNRFRHDLSVAMDPVAAGVAATSPARTRVRCRATA